MHDTPRGTHWHEPKAGENAGFGKFLRKPMPYDSFMDTDGHKAVPYMMVFETKK